MTPCPIHGTLPKLNSGYWEPKLRRNVERDRETDEALQRAGWLVLRFWEHEPPGVVAESIIETLQHSPQTRGPT